MKYLGARLTLLTFCTATLIGCRGLGSSSIPDLPPGTTCTVATAQSSVTGTCTFPTCPPSASNGLVNTNVAYRSSAGNANNVNPIAYASCAPSAAASATPTPAVSATPVATAKPTPTPTPTPTPAPLSGVWLWKGLAVNQGSAQMQGNLPYVSLLNALSGTVQITTNSFAATVSISSNTCPASFNVQASSGGSVTISVNNSVAACAFTVIDPTSGSSVNVKYSNTQ